MRIAIVDDERPARSELRHQIQELLKEAEIVEGDSGAAALQIAGDGKYELFFLDINLGDISGTVLVNAIHNMQPQAKIIFVENLFDPTFSCIFMVFYQIFLIDFQFFLIINCSYFHNYMLY